MTDPRVQTRETPDALEISVDAGPTEPLDDGLLVRIGLDGTGRALRVEALRPLTSSHDLYWIEPGDGRLLLTDHFRTAAAAVPAARRHAPPGAVIDHMLFRTCPGRSSLLSEVHRLGHGERATWERGAPGPLVELTDRLPRGGGPGAGPGAGPTDDPGDGPRGASPEGAVEAALAERIAPLATSVPPPANMLSGGVDSTLVQTFLPPGHPTVSAAVDVPEYAFETEYALRASGLTRSDHTVVNVPVARYLDDLEAAIDGAGLPPHHLQTVLFDAVFRSPHAGYITAQLADALFGLGRARWASLARLGRGVWRPGPWGGAMVAGLRRAGARARGHAELLSQLRRPPASPLGFASLFAVYSDVEAVAAIFGRDAVLARLSERLRYTEDRIEGPPPGDPIDHHLELGQILDFFCDDAVSIWRQLAHSHGKYLVSPFTDRRIARAAMRVPAGRRYAHRGRSKETLKGLLRERLPSYPIHQPKGASGFPFERLHPAGVLAPALDRYGLPDFLDDRGRALARSSSPLAWNVITWAVWAGRVLHNDDLEGPAPALVVERELARPGGPGS